MLAAVSMVGEAHAHLLRAVPADNSRITTLPSHLVLTFSEPAVLTVVWIQKHGGGREKVAGLPTQALRQVSIVLPRLVAGTYTVSFRALSADSHIVPGQIHFTLAPH